MIDWEIKWLDRGREPKDKPDPNYPSGMDVDVSRGATVTCTAPIDYPAPRCGYYSVRCRKCGTNALITTAGRPDDPRSLRMACKGN